MSIRVLALCGGIGGAKLALGLMHEGQEVLRLDLVVDHQAVEGGAVVAEILLL